MDRAGAREAVCRLDLGRLRIDGAWRIDRHLRSPLSALSTGERRGAGSALAQGARCASRCSSARRQGVRRRLSALGAMLLALQLLSWAAWGGEAAPIAENPALEARVQRV